MLTLSNYMQFLLDLDPEEVVLESIDTNALTRLAKEVLRGDDNGGEKM